MVFVMSVVPGGYAQEAADAGTLKKMKALCDRKGDWVWVEADQRCVPIYACEYDHYERYCNNDFQGYSLILPDGEKLVIWSMKQLGAKKPVCDYRSYDEDDYYWFCTDKEKGFVSFKFSKAESERKNTDYFEIACGLFNGHLFKGDDLLKKTCGVSQPDMIGCELGEGVVDRKSFEEFCQRESGLVLTMKNRGMAQGDKTGESCALIKNDICLIETMFYLGGS